MSYILTIPFFSVKLHFKSGGTLVKPLLDGQKVTINESSFKLANAFRNAFQNKVLNEGEYISLMDQYSKGDHYKSEFLLHFKKASDGVSYPDFDIELEYFYKEVERGTWAIVPILDVEAFAEEEEDIEDCLRDVIRLQFLKKRKMPMLQEVISVLWYEAMEMVQHEINLSFHSLKELDNISDEKEDKLISKVAVKLSPGTQVSYGREKELDQLIRAIKSKFNKNVILTGPSGVGKTALVWELARHLKKHRIQSTIWETTASVMIKELSGDTGWQHNLSRLCEELFKNNDILFVRNLLELFEVGKYVGNEVSMADYMRSFISRGEVIMITECSEEELARIQIKNPNYTSLFQTIKLSEPKEGLEKIITQKVKDIAKLRQASLEKEAISETIRLNKRYTPYAGFPGKPIRFLESLLINRTEKSKKVSRSEVIRSFCEETGMPLFMVDPQIPLDLKKVATQFKSNIFGQDAAVDNITGLMASIKTALMRIGKPIASLLFIGPTGVGKTEMAKVLAEFMFGNRDRMIRFDMSEYSDPYSVMRLTGESYFSNGLLTSAVRRDPFSVLLFDEIEKAHPDFNDLLLQILSEGRLTDSSGKLVNFCSTIIIMTSNIGAAGLQTNRIGLSKQTDNTEIKDHFLSAVQKHFRPELYNRIDQVIPFEPLNKTIVRHVVDREISLLRKREGINFRKMDLLIDDIIYDYLAETGYNAKYGARFLQRTIKEKLILPLSEVLSSHEYDEHLIVKIEKKKNQLIPIVDVDPLGLDLLLEELDKINYADYASEMRRKISSLMEGHYYVMMLSELDMMERVKKKLKESFWKNVARSKKYSYYIKTIEVINRMLKEIESHEENLSLSCMDLKDYNPASLTLIKEWEQEFFKQQVALFAYLNPKVNHCTMGIYGSDLNDGMQFYKYLCKQQGYEFTGRSVWFRDSEYNREVPDLEFGGKKKAEKYVYQKYAGEYVFELKAPKQGDVLYGLELNIIGDCCQLFFENESGLQRWQLQTGVGKLIRVEMGEPGFATPPNIHRKEFYKSNPRRTITADSLKDNKYKLHINGNSVTCKEELLVFLIKQFKLKLDSALLS